MNDYISREAVNKIISESCEECRDSCEEFDGFYADCNQCLLHGLKSKLPQLPAADARKARRGRWIKADEQPYFRKKYHTMICSECGKRKDGKWNFCPNCGAYMREE